MSVHQILSKTLTFLDKIKQIVYNNSKILAPLLEERDFYTLKRSFLLLVENLEAIRLISLT